MAGIIFLCLFLLAGVWTSAQADSSVHQLNWNNGTYSTISTDKFSMVANPTINGMTDHTLDLNFSFTGSADKYKAEIRIPAHIFYDRDGAAIGLFEVPLPQYDPANPAVSEPPDAATKFNWRLDPATDEIVISNYAPIVDNFFLTVQIKYRVYPYQVKSGYTKSFSAAMNVETTAGPVETYTSNNLNITYNTKADLYSLTKYSSEAVSYREWQTASWGAPPADFNTADYFYVRWKLYGNANYNDTQPFSVYFKETNPPGDEYGTLFAYSSASSGGFKLASLDQYNNVYNNPTKVIPQPLTYNSSESTNWTSYVYFRYPKTLLDQNLTATVKNQAEIRLLGVDGATDVKQASGQLTFVDQPPSFPPPPATGCQRYTNTTTASAMAASTSWKTTA